MTHGALALREYFFICKNSVPLLDGRVNSFQGLMDEALNNNVVFCPQKTIKIAPLTPCIAKYKDYFVLVTQIFNGIAYFVDHSNPRCMPYDDFLLDFKGYILSEKIGRGSMILEIKECSDVKDKNGQDIL